MKTAPNTIYKMQQKGLISATFKKAVISSINANGASADVYIVGNSQTIIKNIPFSSSVDISKVLQGDKCRIDCFDESNPNDMVIAYTYSKPSKKTFAKGNKTVTSGGVTIPHGMNTIPDIVGITLQASGTVFESAPADDINIYLQSASGSIPVNWFTLKF